MHIPGRNWFKAFSVFLALFSFGLVFAGSAHAASYTVTITQTQFIPGTLAASVGDTITFINNTAATQSAKTTVASGFNSGDIGPGNSKQVTLVNEGTFTYSSLYTPTLTGIVTVSGSSGIGGTTTSTTSGTVSTTITQTQPQPVSGAAENLMALVAAGTAFLAFGSYARWRKENTPMVVSLPLVSMKNGSNDQQSDSPHQNA